MAKLYTALAVLGNLGGWEIFQIFEYDIFSIESGYQAIHMDGHGLTFLAMVTMDVILRLLEE